MACDKELDFLMKQGLPGGRFYCQDAECKSCTDLAGVLVTR